jgi:hypothetical protein
MESRILNSRFTFAMLECTAKLPLLELVLSKATEMLALPESYHFDF